MTKAQQTAKKTATAKAPAKAAASASPSVQAAAAAPVATSGLNRRRVVVGTVVSDKMTKTIVVKVDRRVRHSLYQKYIVKSQRFKAHDEKNEAKIGDRVTLVESRPLSRDKRWALQSIVRRAGQVIEANV